ncbi:serine carboxypeptidase S28 [Trypanosoma theileri]|uniref:Serine carboxypeptidase S28 n=1 Tax=Trypanosoma theileri TaxID=67003 RepID=A0A1X0NM45_9TRYP|nr:serine carboxypeptidase S28 [Trypanosoma theileri]ORC85190.1 serine carboxypeptidase S28 [Trypanosoma theileri]
MNYRFCTPLKLSALGMLLLVLFLMCSASAQGAVHPSIIPPRARGGLVYLEALKQHQQPEEEEQQRQERKEGYKHKYTTTSDLRAQYYDQAIDHNDPAAGQFRQRWWVDRTAWDDQNGPAILYVNGEGPASGVPNGAVLKYSRAVRAAVFSLEHRFYGDSMPAPLTNRSMLKHLTVANALADLRAFKQYAEQVVLGKKVKWLIVGGSYAGALSAWARTAFPDDFFAAWSSSGVVNAIFDYNAFDGHLLDVLPPACAVAIRSIFEEFSVAYDDPVRRKSMMQDFGTPDYFTKADMAWMLADGSAMAVQYGYKDNLCSALQPVNMSNPFKQYGDFVRSLWGDSFTSDCYYSTECLSNAKYSDQWDSSYAWVYQCCSELAYWQISYPGSLRLSDVTTSYFISQCRAAFGEMQLPDTFAFNKKHGGSHPAATRVVATQGSDDPWLPAGVTETLNEEYPVLIAQCNGCGHCGDLSEPSSSDPPSLVAQRMTLRNYLDTWFQN